MSRLVMPTASVAGFLLTVVHLCLHASHPAHVSTEILHRDSLSRENAVCAKTIGQKSSISAPGAGAVMKVNSPSRVLPGHKLAATITSGPRLTAGTSLATAPVEARVSGAAAEGTRATPRSDLRPAPFFIRARAANVKEATEDTSD